MFRKLVNRLGYDVIRHPNRRSYEWHILQVFDHLKIDTVIDVGANHGQFASTMRNAGYSGWIYSIEPVKSIYDALEHRMSGDARWRGFNCALGETEERRSLNVARGDGQASSFLTFNDDGPERWGEDHTVARTEVVDVHRLENILAQIIAERPGASIYLKLDTQGLDLAVLRSAGDNISLIKGMQAEISAHQYYEGMVSFGDTINAYQSLGFDITGVFPISREFDNLRVIEFDFVFIRA